MPLLSDTEKMLLISVINVLVLALVPLVLLGVSGAAPADLGLTFEGLGPAAALGARAFLLVTPIVYAINGLAEVGYQLVFKPTPHPLELMLREEMSPFRIGLALVSAALLAPAAEELLFRGVLQGWLNGVLFAKPRKREPLFTAEDALDGDRVIWEEPPRAVPPLLPGPWRNCPDLPPVILTSILFALVHAPQMPAPIAIFALSLALGMLYQRTGNLLAPFLLHALFNGLSTLLALAAFS